MSVCLSICLPSVVYLTVFFCLSICSVLFFAFFLSFFSVFLVLHVCLSFSMYVFSCLSVGLALSTCLSGAIYLVLSVLCCLVTRAHKQASIHIDPYSIMSPLPMSRPPSVQRPAHQLLHHRAGHRHHPAGVCDHRVLRVPAPGVPPLQGHHRSLPPRVHQRHAPRAAQLHRPQHLAARCLPR